MTQSSTNPESREIVVTSFVQAPASAAYHAYLQPMSVQRWWPFERMTMPVCDADVRVGGGYRYVGRVPDGTEYAFHGEYRELVENRRIVHTEVFEAFPDAESICTVTFSPKDDGTELVSRIVFPSDEAFKNSAGSGMEEGMRTSIDRLSEVAADRSLKISRHLDVSPARIFEAWTNPAQLAQWWAPKPWTVSKVEMDARTGGRSAITMRSPEGAEFPNDGVFLEVVENRRLVFTDAFTGDWEPKPNPFMTGIITLEEEDKGTRYTAEVRHWSVEARQRHEAMGFYEGWNVCLDQLQALVESR